MGTKISFVVIKTVLKVWEKGSSKKVPEFISFIFFIKEILISKKRMESLNQKHIIIKSG